MVCEEEGDSMTRLTGDAMREIAGKVFGERSMTLSAAGDGYTLDEMTGAVRALRRMMASALESSPESAFAAQPAADGEAGWAAGQVIAHIANSQVSMIGAVRSLLGMPAVDGARRDLDQLPDRDEALATLAETSQSFDEFVSGIPADADLAKTMTHERFGEMSTNGWMMLIALHEGDHLRQVRALSGA
jgi:hypothetical protein